MMKIQTKSGKQLDWIVPFRIIQKLKFKQGERASDFTGTNHDCDE
jgi:hypothetical protein